MKKRFILVLLSTVLIVTACATHSLRVQGDTVRLYLTKANAHRVYFASSVDGYELHRANRVSRTTWEVIVPSNRAFTYFYVVDDEVYLPSCKYKEKDDFGLENCLYCPGM